MHILADIKEIVKNKIYIGTKTIFGYFIYKFCLFFNVKDFILDKYTCEIYILADIK